MYDLESAQCIPVSMYRKYVNEHVYFLYMMTNNLQQTDIPESPGTAINIRKWRWRTVTVSIWLSSCSSYVVRWRDWWRTVGSWLHICYNDRQYITCYTTTLLCSTQSYQFCNQNFYTIAKRLIQNAYRKVLDLAMEVETVQESNTVFQAVSVHMVLRGLMSEVSWQTQKLTDLKELSGHFDCLLDLAEDQSFHRSA